MPPPPSRARRTPGRIGGPGGGRHRRPQPPSRLVLLTVFAVLALLLGSGTAISLTAAPASPQAGDPEAAALGAAPVTAGPASPDAPPPTPTATPADPPSSEPEPEPEPEPTDPPEEEPDGEPSADPVDEITRLEDEVTELTNAERAAAGCEPVQTDERLRDAARGHSQDMATNDYFDHTGLDGRSPFDRMSDTGYPVPAGENIAYGYRTPADVMEGWMDSDGHRENLLNCEHRAIGVGLAYDPDGRPYWTQNFGQ